MAFIILNVLRHSYQKKTVFIFDETWIFTYGQETKQQIMY